MEDQPFIKSYLSSPTHCCRQFSRHWSTFGTAAWQLRGCTSHDFSNIKLKGIRHSNSCHNERCPSPGIHAQLFPRAIPDIQDIQIALLQPYCPRRKKGSTIHNNLSSHWVIRISAGCWRSVQPKIQLISVNWMETTHCFPMLFRVMGGRLGRFCREQFALDVSLRT